MFPLLTAAAFTESLFSFFFKESELYLLYFLLARKRVLWQNEIKYVGQSFKRVSVKPTAPNLFAEEISLISSE